MRRFALLSALLLVVGVLSSACAALATPTRRDAWPADALGDRLRAWEAEGEDLTVPRLLSFQLFAPDGSGATGAAQLLREGGYRVDVLAPSDEVGASEVDWEITATLSMVPAYDAIRDTAGALSKLVQVYGGHASGCELLPLGSAREAAAAVDR
jgi:hypothetical protein